MEGNTNALQAAAKAWKNLNHAEHAMARLRGYRQMSKAMRADFNSFSQQAAAARKTLNSVLKVAA